MWQENNTIAKQIARSNRNLLVANCILLVVVIFSFICGFRLLFNEIAGPVAIEAKSLVSMKEPHKDFRYYFKVSGGKIIKDPIFEEEYVTYDRHSGEVKTREVQTLYYLMFVPSAGTGYKALVVASGSPITSSVVQGALVLIPGKLKSQLEASMPKGMMSDIMLPTMLDMQRFNGGSYFSCVFYVPLFLLAIWNILKAKKRIDSIEEHPIAKQLAAYGSPRDVAVAIEDEIRQSTLLKSGSNLIVTPNWLIMQGVWGSTVVNVDDLIWIYRKETQHRVNFVPTGKSHAAVFCFANKKYAEVSLPSDKQANEVLALVAQRACCYLGYSEELLGMWNKNKDQMIAEVRKARTEAATQDRSAN